MENGSILLFKCDSYLLVCPLLPSVQKSVVPIFVGHLSNCDFSSSSMNIDTFSPGFVIKPDYSIIFIQGPYTQRYYSRETPSDDAKWKPDKKMLSIMHRVFRKNCVFHNSLQPLPRLHRCKRPSKLSNAMRVYSHSCWLVTFCTTNSSQVLVRQRLQNIENSWENKQNI